MKKTKKIAIILIATIMLTMFCANVKVLASDVTNPGDNARTVTNPEGEPVTTSETNQDGEPVNTSETNPEGEPINTDEDGHDHSDEEIHNGDLYIINNDSEYVMDQLVDGNVFIIGKNVKVTGEINGSLFAMASESLTIEEGAYVACHAFLFAETVNIKGMVYDLYSASMNLNVNEDGIVYRDLRGTAEKINLAGIVGRDVKLYAGTITIPEEEKKLTIYGDFNYQARNEIANLDKATINGETTYEAVKEKEAQDMSEIILNGVMSVIGTIVFDIAVYLYLLFLAPKFIEKSKEYVSTKGLLGLAIGLAFTIIVPMLCFILLMTGVGSGLSVLLVLIYSVVLMLNACITSIVTNEFISSKLNFANNTLKKVLLLIPISSIIWIIRKIPLIG